jgi:hypothetical protein
MYASCCFLTAGRVLKAGCNTLYSTERINITLYLAHQELSAFFYQRLKSPMLSVDVSYSKSVRSQILKKIQKFLELTIVFYAI